MSTFQKDVSYNAQGDAIYSNASNYVPAASSTSNFVPTTSTSTYSSTYVAPVASQSVAGVGSVADNPNLYDNSGKGKMLRFYNKIETSMRKKFDASSGPSSRQDPLGGYTVKGPGYYEKKHKFTRRVTSRGTPPASAMASVPGSGYSSYSTTTTTTPTSTYSSSTTTPVSSSGYSSSSSFASNPPVSNYNPSPASNIQSYSTPSAPVTMETTGPSSYDSPSVPVH